MTAYTSNGPHFIQLVFILVYYTVSIVEILYFSTEMDAKDLKCLFESKWLKFYSVNKNRLLILLVCYVD